MLCSCGCGIELPKRPYKTNYLPGHSNNWKYYTRSTGTCLVCKGAFTHPPSVKKKYCSRRCYNNRNPKVELVCHTCKTTFSRYACEVKKGGRRAFCSKNCYNSARRNGYSLKMEKHPQWKGGVTPEVHRIRSRYKHKQWRKEVKKRDGQKCRKCGDNENLHVHHIKSFSKYPKLRFDLNNGMILCLKCHKKTDSYCKG